MLCFADSRGAGGLGSNRDNSGVEAQVYRTSFTDTKKCLLSLLGNSACPTQLSPSQGLLKILWPASNGKKVMVGIILSQAICNRVTSKLISSNLQ